MQTTDGNVDSQLNKTARVIPPLWLLLLALAVLVGGGFYVMIWHPWQVRTQLISELESAGLRVEYEPVGPQWLRDLTGTHKFGFSMNPKGGGILDKVIGVSVCPSGRPAKVPKEIPFEAIQSLTLFPDLQHLDLNYSNVKDDWMPAIAQLKSLRILELGHARVCGRGFGPLNSLLQLEELNLVYCPVRDEYLDDLTAIRSLKKINLFRCTHLTPNGISHLQQSMPGLAVHLDRKMQQSMSDLTNGRESTSQSR